MKRSVLIFLALAALLPVLFAQYDNSQPQSGCPMTVEVQKQIDNDGKTNVTVYTQNMMPAMSDVYFGIFVEDLTSDKAEDIDYEENYGILISKVLPDTPAEAYGMQADDIIMEINGEQVSDKAKFDEIRSNLHPGDIAEIVIWKAGETKYIEMTMVARPENTEVTTTTISESPGKKGKLSAGYGGGSYIPIWFMPDLADVNTLITGLGFSAMDENGVFMSGGAGKGMIGKGFFIGGMGASSEFKKDMVNATDPAYHDWLSYSATFGGVTLDKRIPFTRDFIGSLGLMVGGGSHEVKITHTDQNPSWPGGFTGDYSATISREYMVVQPRVELMYRLLDWLAIRAEFGYVWGYAPKDGWKLQGPNGDDYDISGSPNTTFQGMTFSVGPWFGF